MPTKASEPTRYDAAPCTCGRERASFSYRLGRLACARCHFGAIPKAEREATDRGWARRDLAGQVRSIAHRLPRGDARAVRLRDAAFDLELADSDRAAVPVLDELRATGIELEVRE